MGRACKCRYCGKVLDTDIAYRMVVNEKNRYYCSAQHYQDELDNKIYRVMLMNLCYDLLNIKFKDGGTFVSKNIEQIKGEYSYKQLYQIVDDMSLDIQMALEDIQNNGGKMPYMFAMIKNRLFTLNDTPYERKVEYTETIKAEDIKFEEPIVVSKPKKKKAQTKPKTFDEIDFEIDF